jgi:hypothetical protein
VVSRATTRNPGFTDPSQLYYRILAFLPGLRLRSHPTYHATFGTPRIQFYEEGEAEKTRHVDLDSLEEQRMAAVMRQAVTP